MRLDPPEAEAVGTCKYCHDDICAGEKIVTFDGEAYHDDCFFENAAYILLDKGYATDGVAEEEL